MDTTSSPRKAGAKILQRLRGGPPPACDLAGREVFIVIYAVGSGGRTASVLDQCETFADLGMTPTIVTFGYTRDPVAALDGALQGRELPPRTTVVNLYEDLRWRDAEGRDAALAAPAEIDDPELSVATHTTGATTELSYFDDHGRRVLVRRLQNARTERDTLFRDGVPSLIREYDPRGFRTRELSLHGAENAVAEERYFAPDGFCFATRTLDPADGRQRSHFWHQRDRRESRRFAHNTPWHTAWLDEFLQSRRGEGRPPFIIAESPSAVLKVLDIDPARGHRLYMFHENHLSAPHVLGAKVRQDYGNAPKRLGEMPLVIVPTDSQAQDIRTQFGAEVRVRGIGNLVVDKRTPAAGTTTPGRIGVFGRLAASKRVDEALEIFRAVHERAPHARFEIFGDGPERAKLEKRAEQLGVSEAVTFHGRVPDAADEMAACAVTVSTSATESFGLSIAESLAAGTPVVSYAVNYGPRDLIRDGEDGFLVEPGDAETFADRLVELLEDPARAQRMGEHAERRMAEDFSRHSFTSAWETALHDAEAHDR